MQYSLCSTVYCSSKLQDVDIAVLKIIYPVYMYIICICIYIHKEFKNSTPLSITFFDLEIRALLESDTDSMKTFRIQLWGSRV